MGFEIKGLVGRSAMHPSERKTISQLLPNRGFVIEVGTHEGVTVACWANSHKEALFLSIDPCSAHHGQLVTWKRNARDNMLLFVGTLQDWVKVSTKSADVIVIDGDHSYEACLQDLISSQYVIKDSGLIVCHDYGRLNIPELQGVTVAVDAFCKRTEWSVSQVFRHTAFLRRACR